MRRIVKDAGRYRELWMGSLISFAFSKSRRELGEREAAEILDMQ